MAAAVAQSVPPPPPGFTLDQPADGGGVPPPPPGFTLDSAPAAASTQTEPPSLLRRAGNAWLNYGPASVIEPAANLASGMLSMPLAGLAGITQKGLNIAGIDQTQPADATSEVMERLTYQPKTAGGQAVQRVIQYPFAKLAQFADAAGEPIAMQTDGQPRFRGPMQAEAMRKWDAAGRPAAEGSPAVATGVNTAIQALPSLLLRGPKGKPATRAAVADVSKTAQQIAPRQALVDELIGKGLKVTPVQAGAKAGSIAEGLSGAAKLERSISIKNAPRVNELVAEDLGLKGVKEFTPADITRLKVEANKGYNEIAKTGVRKTSNEYRQEIRSIGDRTGGASFAGDVPPDIVKLKKYYESRPQFTAQDAVSKIRQLRAEASKNIKAVNAPEQNAKGHVQRAIAEALDNELTRHAESIGRPELAANYKDSRVQLAKIHTLEDALDGSNVSVADLARAYERGAPLSGNMELLARAGTEFDRSFQNVTKIRDSAPVGVLDGVLAVAGSAIDPSLAAALIARPAVRAILTSDKYQSSLVSGKKGPDAKPRASGVKPKEVAKPAVASQQKREAR